MKPRDSIERISLRALFVACALASTVLCIVLEPFIYHGFSNIFHRILALGALLIFYIYSLVFIWRVYKSTILTPKTR